uniref:Uncharacterized protein n=1 Tax=Fusarium oxysporum (strain Fo5176) TaxID=660025 RepID=A0A0D2YAI2_FUSOF
MEFHGHRGLRSFMGFRRINRYSNKPADISFLTYETNSITVILTDLPVCKLGFVELDIENDASIEAAVASLEREYGKLDDNLADIRGASNSCYNNLITSNAVVTHAFGKLLRKCSEPRVIMISSARGSMARTNNKEAAENHSNNGTNITFWAVSPGHCKTAFNGYKGRKDPLEGAEAVVRLLESTKGDIEPGTFWEYENGSFQQVPCLPLSTSSRRLQTVKEPNEPITPKFQVDLMSTSSFHRLNCFNANVL